MGLSTTPRTWVAGETVTGAMLNTEIRDALTGIQAAWTAYTPAQTGISLGNGTLTGFYQLTGKTLDLNISFTFGSTTTYGTGDILLGLPSGMTGLRGQVALPAIMFDASSGFDYLGTGKLTSAGAMIAVGLNGGFVASINTSLPFAWATDDSLTISGRIEIT